MRLRRQAEGSSPAGRESCPLHGGDICARSWKHMKALIGCTPCGRMLKGLAWSPLSHNSHHSCVGGRGWYGRCATQVFQTGDLCYRTNVTSPPVTCIPPLGTPCSCESLSRPVTLTTAPADNTETGECKECEMHSPFEWRWEFISLLCLDVKSILNMNIRLCKIITEFLECSYQISNNFNTVSNDPLGLSAFMASCL